jgi:hypothetical protein
MKKFMLVGVAALVAVGAACGGGSSSGAHSAATPPIDSMNCAQLARAYPHVLDRYHRAQAAHDPRRLDAALADYVAVESRDVDLGGCPDPGLAALYADLAQKGSR